MLQNDLKSIGTKGINEITPAKNSQELFNIEKKYIGRKGQLTEILRNLKNISEDERKVVGQLANEIKNNIIHALEDKKRDLSAKSFDFEKEKIDVTIPAKKIEQGHLHPITRVQNDVEDIFTAMGFEIAEGPEVETEWYNFDALNIPKDHPSRDAWDTFWLKSRTGADGTQTIADIKKLDKSQHGSASSLRKSALLLRTHTSPVQVRYMEKHKPPFRIIVPGKCFRHEATDAVHEHTFYQFEALVVGEDINVGNFKYIGEQFFSRFFKSDVKVRIRPSFFPFTEPSFEFDISCTVCDGKGCQSCKNGGWLEMGGAGMVNQQVFVKAGYPRNKYQGFAWGFGLERLAMMKYKINDIRLFHSGDLRFINQF